MRQHCAQTRKIQVQSAISDFKLYHYPALFWHLMVQGMNHVEEGLKKYEARVAHTEQWLLQRMARKHGLVLLPKAT